MESLEALAKRHQKEFPDFQYYGALAEFISAIETYHEDLHTGISSDCCNSLLQSICKTIITQIDSVSPDSFKKWKTDKLIKEATKLLQKNDDIYERNLAGSIAKIGSHINDVRNARGDLSHGKCIPKELANDGDLSRLLREITESLSRYLISSFFSFELERLDRESEIEEERIK